MALLILPPLRMRQELKQQTAMQAGLRNSPKVL
jgi:hypothetical protein